MLVESQLLKAWKWWMRCFTAFLLQEHSRLKGKRGLVFPQQSHTPHAKRQPVHVKSTQGHTERFTDQTPDTTNLHFNILVKKKPSLVWKCWARRHPQHDHIGTHVAYNNTYSMHSCHQADKKRRVYLKKTPRSGPKTWQRTSSCTDLCRLA